MRERTETESLYSGSGSYFSSRKKPPVPERAVAYYLLGNLEKESALIGMGRRLRVSNAMA